VPSTKIGGPQNAAWRLLVDFGSSAPVWYSQIGLSCPTFFARDLGQRRMSGAPASRPKPASQCRMRVARADQRTEIMKTVAGFGRGPSKRGPTGLCGTTGLVAGVFGAGWQPVLNQTGRRIVNPPSFPDLEISNRRN